MYLIRWVRWSTGLKTNCWSKIESNGPTQVCIYALETDEMNTAREWYQDWFGKDYLAVYPHRNAAQAAAEVRFISEVLNLSPDQLIFDMACGAGRHLIHLREAGLNAFGGDLSLVLLRESLSCAGAPAGGVVRYDKRSFPFRDQSIDCVLNLFTSFGYFFTDAEHMQVLQNVRCVLKSGGRFFLDFMNASWAISNLVPLSEREVDGLRVTEARCYKPESGRIEKTITIVNDKSEPRRYSESVRAYTHEELEELVSGAGFKVLQRFGSFAGESFRPDSDRLILVMEVNG